MGARSGVVYLHGALGRRVEAPASGGAGRGEEVRAYVMTGFGAMPMRNGGITDTWGL
jgi:hypothetical protein